MAYALLTTSSRLSSTDAGVWSMTAVGALSIRIKPSWGATDAVDHAIFDNGYQVDAVTTYRTCRFQKFSDNNVYIGFVDQGLGDFRVVAAATSGMFAAGEWRTHSIIWSTSTGTAYYVAGALRGATSTLSQISIGTTNARQTFGMSFENSTYGRPGLCDVAEYGRWNRLLTSNEVDALSSGYAPSWFRNGLIEYRPFADYSGSQGSLANGPDVTPNAASASLDAHPTTVAPPPLLL